MSADKALSGNSNRSDSDTEPPDSIRGWRKGNFYGDSDARSNTPDRMNKFRPRKLSFSGATKPDAQNQKPAGCQRPLSGWPDARRSWDDFSSATNPFWTPAVVYESDFDAHPVRFSRKGSKTTCPSLSINRGTFKALLRMAHAARQHKRGWDALLHLRKTLEIASLERKSRLSMLEEDGNTEEDSARIQAQLQMLDMQIAEYQEQEHALSVEVEMIKNDRDIECMVLASAIDNAMVALGVMSSQQEPDAEPAVPFRPLDLEEVSADPSEEESDLSETRSIDSTESDLPSSKSGANTPKTPENRKLPFAVEDDSRLGNERSIESALQKDVRKKRLQVLAAEAKYKAERSDYDIKLNQYIRKNMLKKVPEGDILAHRMRLEDEFGNVWFVKSTALTREWTDAEKTYLDAKKALRAWLLENRPEEVVGPEWKYPADYCSLSLAQKKRIEDWIDAIEHITWSTYIETLSPEALGNQREGRDFTGEGDWEALLDGKSDYVQHGDNEDDLHLAQGELRLRIDHYQKKCAGLRPESASQSA